MSRKATERRFNPDAFVEANLWVVTRGRKYKPRFRAERAVVIVSGGGAVRADAQVAPPRTVHGRRAADASSPAEHSRDPPRHPWPRCSVPRTRRRRSSRTPRATRCTSSTSPAARRHARRAGVAVPGAVAKSTARLLKKLNVSDALLAASGADVAVLLKVPRRRRRTQSRRAPRARRRRARCRARRRRAAAGDGAARRLRGTSASGTCRRNTRRGCSARRRRVRAGLLAEAFPDADATDAATDECEEKAFSFSAKEAWNKGLLVERKNARERFAAAMAPAARAGVARRRAPPRVARVAGRARVHAHVTFEHDKHSKQIQQVARDVTDAVAAAAAEENAKARFRTVPTPRPFRAKCRLGDPQRRRRDGRRDGRARVGRFRQLRVAFRRRRRL